MIFHFASNTIFFFTSSPSLLSIRRIFFLHHHLLPLLITSIESTVVYFGYFILRGKNYFLRLSEWSAWCTQMKSQKLRYHRSPESENKFWTYCGRRFDIIRSASSGVGGENFSSCDGTSPGCTVIIFVDVVVVVDAKLEWDVATSSVGKKSGTNFALERDDKK